MPELDDRLTAALRDAAREPGGADVGADDVTARVAAKRAHRRRVRQVRAAVLSIAVVVAVAGATLAIVDTGGGGGGGGSAGRRQVAAGGTNGTVSVRVVDGATVAGPLRSTGRAATVRPLPLSPSTAESYVRGPLTAAGDLVTATAYHPDGAGFTYPPSAIVRFDGATGRVTDRVDLQGEVEALSDGEGARFAQTRDKTVTGPQDPEFRVKRITADDNHVSNPIPPPNHPAGTLVAGGGAVWVPVTDGVLRFDAVSGAYAGKVALPTATDRRGVALLGKGFAYVTDGTTLRRLDPGSDATPAPEVAFRDPAVGPLLDVAPVGFDAVALAHDARTGGFVLVKFAVLPGAAGSASTTGVVALPAGVDATALHTANDVTWVEGTLDGAPVALVLAADATRVERTVVLLDARDQSITFTSRTTAVLASAGTLSRVTW
jgi:hypothetical protein